MMLTKLWQIKSDGLLEAMKKTGLDYEDKLENWVEEDVDILSEDYIVIGRQVETDLSYFIDILCIDKNGNLVAVELKRGKTPRDVTAQVLDYGAWISELSHEQIIHIADTYLEKKTGKKFSKTFRDKFGIDLPEEINKSHRMLIVGTEIDKSTERIVNYLSETYYVGINAIKFSYFINDRGDSILVRNYIIDPDTAQERIENQPIIRKTRTFDELADIARKNGIFELFSYFDGKLTKKFNRRSTTRYSLVYSGWINDQLLTIFHLYPEGNEGVKFDFYIKRFCSYFNIDEKYLQKEVLSTFDKEIAAEDYSDDWSMFGDEFTDKEQASAFLDKFTPYWASA